MFDGQTVTLVAARGETLAAILASTAKVAEGVETTRSIRALAGRLGADLPIAEEVHRVLFEGKPPREWFEQQRSRPVPLDPVTAKAAYIAQGDANADGKLSFDEYLAIRNAGFDAKQVPVSWPSFLCILFWSTRSWALSETCRNLFTGMPDSEDFADASSGSCTARSYVSATAFIDGRIIG